MSNRTNSHTISHAENIYSGDASIRGGGRGIPRASLVQVDLGTPEISDPNGVCEAQNIGAAGDLSLNGADVSGGVATFDVPRGVVIDSGGAETAVATIYGTDQYGVSIQEDITFDGTTAVFGLKAFKKITRVAVDGQISNSCFVGDSDILGLPFRLENLADVVVINENDSNLFGVVAQTAANPAGATAVALVAASSTALTITAAIDTLTAVNGSGMTSTQEGEVDVLFAQTKTDLDATKVEVDRLVAENDDVKVQFDKMVTDVEAIRAEVIKLVADSVAVDVGTLVKADATVTATATTGDVRGTYNPTTVLNGSKVIKLLLKPKGRNTRNAYGSVQYRA